jgi:hypothetical protein
MVYKPESILDTSESAWVAFFLRSVDSSNTSDPVVFNISCKRGTLMLPISATLPACYTDTAGVRACAPRGTQVTEPKQIRHISVSGTVSEINQIVGLVGYTPGGAHVDVLSFLASNKGSLAPSNATIELCSCSAVGKCVKTGETSCTCNAGWSAGKQSKSCEVGHRSAHQRSCQQILGCVDFI